MEVKYFNKKVYNFRLFFSDIFYLISNVFELRKLNKNKEINNVFREK